jgi:uncharacterized protein YcfL
MKRFFIAVSIVLLLSCDDKSEDKNMNENPEQEVVIKEPIPVSNIHHTKDENTYTIKWDHDGQTCWKLM